MRSGAWKETSQMESWRHPRMVQAPRMGCRGFCFAEVHCDVGDVEIERQEARLQESTKNAVSKVVFWVNAILKG
jgi:hypothetical protein